MNIEKQKQNQTLIGLLSEMFVDTPDGSVKPTKDAAEFYKTLGSVMDELDADLADLPGKTKRHIHSKHPPAFCHSKCNDFICICPLI